MRVVTNEPAPLPHDLAVERALLGSLIVRPAAAMDALDLSPASFYSDKHRLLFRAIAEALKRYADADPQAVRRVLEERKQLDDAGGPAYILGLVDEANPRSVKAYAKILREDETRRAIISGARDAAAIARSAGADEAHAALREFVDRLQAPATDGLHVVSMDSVLGPLEEIPWLADGWLGKGDVCILAGEWATGKSVVAMDLAISVAAGIPWMKHVPIRQGPVLYVDEENSERNVRRRLRRMLRGRDLPESDVSTLPLRYLSANMLRLDRPKGRAMLKAEVEKFRPTLVILDALVRFHRGDENAARDVSALFGEAIVPIARQNDASVVCLDHMSKPNADTKGIDAGHRIRGSGDKAGVGDSIWTLEGERDSDERTLHCRKSRWSDSLPPPITTKWVVSEDEEAAWIDARDAVLQADTLVCVIVMEAGDSGLYAGELVEGIVRRGVAERTAHRAIKRAWQNGSIERIKEPGRRVRYYPRGTKRP